MGATVERTLPPTSRTLAVVSLLTACLLAAACSSDDDAAPGGGAGSGTAGGAAGASAGSAGASAGSAGAPAGSGGTGGGAAGAGGDGTQIAITGTVQEIVLGGASAPIADATVCVLDMPSSCVKTDASGGYQLAGPANVDSGVTFAKAGYLGVVRLGRNGVTAFDLGPTTLFTAAAAEAAAKAAGFTWPTGGKGVISASAIVKSGAGYVTLADATIAIDVPVEKGPVYTQPDGTPDPKLQKTSEDGVAYFGGVAPGAKFEITVTVPGKICDEVKSGWQTASGKGAGVVVADSVTFIGVACH